LLPKIAYNQLLKKIEHIKAAWLEDRKENPKMVPYDVKSNLTHAIERIVREHHIHCGGLKGTEQFVNNMLEYLIAKKIIIGHPLGGCMFELPKDHAPIPSEAEFVAQVKQQLKQNP